MRHRTIARSLICSLVWLWACSSPNAEPPAVDITPEVELDVEPDSGLDDAAQSDVAEATDAAVQFDSGPEADAAVATDAVEADGNATFEVEVSISCEWAKSPLPGEAGAPCTSAADCTSGFCLESENGYICTEQCASCCPGGFACNAFGIGAGVYLLCSPTTERLCRPCLDDKDCGTSAQPAARCLDYGAEGRYCGASCDGNSNCPTDYTCALAGGWSKGQSTSATKQCVRNASAGVCPCSYKAYIQGANTTCSSGNSFGTCSGVRMCVSGGLTACSAVEPSAEVTNSIDDDCDGQTDE